MQGEQADNMRLIYSSIAFLFLAIAVAASPVKFDTNSYNFALAGGGGGESGVLNSVLSVETFCDNFNDEIHVGHTDYSAFLSTLTTGSDLSHTRFGSNSGWRTISISDGDSQDASDAAVINGANVLARYQMAAFLVTQYQTRQGSNAYNNGIQGAIWDIFDPSSSPAAPKHANANEALEQAAEWFANPNSDKSFLADFLIVSDSTMTWTGAGEPLTRGFQEQLAMVSPVPEPGATGWVLFGLFSLFACLRGPARVMKSGTFPHHELSRSDCFGGTYQTGTPRVPVLVPGNRTSTH